MAKKIIKGVSVALLCVVAVFGVFLAVSAAMEYRPEAVERIEITPGGAGRGVAPGDSITLVTYNVGYAGLGRDEDFFMDGGENVRPESETEVRANLAGIEGALAQYPADVYFIQEADVDSGRSYRIDEAAALTGATGMNAAFAYNYNSLYVPYPVPAIGKVESGLLTLTDLNAARAERVSLPVPFRWPVRMFNLKRCLLVERVPVGERSLVLVNLHLEAYDDGEGKEAQTRELTRVLREEYAKGNYVIAGGDFNQIFPGAEYPAVADDWTPGMLEESMLPEGWRFAYDPSSPTCRLLNEPFTGDYAATQLYVIDGYVLSPNVRPDMVETLDLGFEYADHNPVRLRVTLG